MGKDELNFKKIYDENGNLEAVIVPIDQWEAMNKERGAEEEDDEPVDVEANLRQALEEVKLYKEGKLEFTSARDFLNEL